MTTPTIPDDEAIAALARLYLLAERAKRQQAARQLAIAFWRRRNKSGVSGAG